MSASVYYTASWYYYFYKDYTNFVNLNVGYYQGIVYTSDMSMSSCYTMQTTPASSLVTLTTDIITLLSTSIYGTSTNTFVDDANAYTTVDII